MDIYFLVKTLHILSSTILFGTGIGIAFFMFRSFSNNNIQQKLYAANNTVLADYIFTLPAVIIQPISGFWLVWQSGYSWSEPWLIKSYFLYLLAGLCWLPVVCIQLQLKKILVQHGASTEALAKRYNTLFKIWFLLGWPAFISLLIIFYLMVAKPT